MFLRKPAYRRSSDRWEVPIVNPTLLRRDLQWIALTDGLLWEITDIARVYADRCEWSKLPATTRWNFFGR